MKGTKEKSFNNKKFITTIIAAILYTLVIVMTMITVISTTRASNLAFGRYRFYIMKSSSQPQIANPSDLVITKKMKNGEIKEKDFVVYKDDNFYYCDEIVDTSQDGTIEKMIISEKNGIKYQLAESEVEGKIVKTIPKIGGIVEYLRTPFGCVVFILFAILFFILIKLILFKRLFGV